MSWIQQRRQRLKECAALHPFNPEQALNEFWSSDAKMQPQDFLTYGSYYEWALETGSFPFRLKYQNPNTLPRRWQSHMR